MNAIAQVIRTQLNARNDLLSATMKFERAPQESINLFWNTFYNSEFVKCDIPYSAEWENGTGYLNGLMDEALPELEEGEIARSITEKGRRILVVKTCFGNVVLFERFIPTPEGTLTGPIVQNTPRLVHKSEMFRAHSQLQMSDLTDALGDGWTHDNVGLRLNGFFGAIKRAEEKKARPISIEADIARAAE